MKSEEVNQYAENIALPKVSVVVPVFNGSTTITACVESLLKQTYPERLTEILFVNNNSTDDTEEILTRYRVAILHEKIQTSYAARNRGISAATGSIIALTDADCVAHPQWIERLITPFLQPNVGAVRGIIEPLYEGALIEDFIAKNNPLATTHSEGMAVLLTANVAYRKDIISNLGLFDEKLFTAGDVDLGWRLQLNTDSEVILKHDAIVYHINRDTLRGLFGIHQRYGFSEILLDTLYKDCSRYNRTPLKQLFRMISQLLAVPRYMISMVVRRFKKRTGIAEYENIDLYLAWPWLQLIAEIGSLYGKCQAIISTRGFSKNPYMSRSDIVFSRTGN